MNIEELMLKREEIPILTHEGDIYSAQSLITPVPRIIFNGLNYEESKSCAINAINYSIDKSLKEGILYEADKRKKFDETIIESLNSSNDAFKAIPKILCKLNLSESEESLPISKWADSTYVCLRAHYLKNNEYDSAMFDRFKRAMLDCSAKKKGDEKEYLINHTNRYPNNLFSFGLPGNGVCCHLSSGFFTYQDFNMPQEKFNKICPKETIGYFCHNVDYTYQALLLRELEINYINNLISKIKE